MPDNYDKIIRENEEGIQGLAGYSPSHEDSKLVKYLQMMFEESAKARAHKVPRWRRNEELYNGDFFKPFKLPKYKSRVVANVIHSVVETIYSILTDRFPKVDIMPRTEQQVDMAKEAQEAVESEMAKYKAARAIAMMKRDGLIYGNGFLKTCLGDDGHVEFHVPDIYTVFVDPLATNIQNTKCAIFANPTYVDDVRDKFENGKYVTAEGSLDEYRSFVREHKENDTGMSQVTTASGGNTGVSAGDVRTDYMEQSPAYSAASNKRYGGGQVLLKEAWHYMGDKLYLTTWAGNVLLQHQESPYDYIPLVTFQNYQDEHHFWGKGEPEIIEPLAVGAAVLMSQAVDNVLYHGNPAWVMSKNMTQTPGNRPTDKPGQIFYVNGPHESISRLPAGDMSSSTLPLIQNMVQLADTVSGVHDITQGRNPSGVTASRAIAQLQEASQQIIRAKEREVGSDAVVDIYIQTLSILARNYEQPINLRQSKDGGGYEFKIVYPHKLSPELDFKYVPGSSLPESRAQRIDQALDFMQMGLLNPEQFWQWTQKDVSKEILEDLQKAREMQEQAMAQQDETLQTSTNEDEILEALMMKRNQMGMGGEEG
tara:strand:+ start:4660 stop:6441 length:1782 start_codon:yes stop_codon:yes gene_type:complete